MSTPSLPTTSVASSMPGSGSQGAATTTRLPGNDAFSAFGDMQPGTLPLLVRIPGGGCEQIDVPLGSTVDDVKATVQQFTDHSSIDELRLSFGNSELDPSSHLIDTNIVDAYEHASSFLQVIGSSSQDAETKVAALDSVCAVVKNISNGVKDMETLCDAAANAESVKADLDNSKMDTPIQSSTRSTSTAGQSVNESEVPTSTTPSTLIQGLSRRLPNLFNPEATARIFPQGAQNKAPEAHVEPQPSLTSIREARRMARASAAMSLEELAISDPKPPEEEDNIGISTYNRLLPNDLASDSPQESTPNVLLAHSDRTTWLEDVMKTWEVGTVRKSGVLEKSKDGQAVNQYLNNLEAEAMRETTLDPDPSGETTVGTIGNDTNEADGNEDNENDGDDDDDIDIAGGSSDEDGQNGRSDAQRPSQHQLLGGTPSQGGMMGPTVPAVSISAEVLNNNEPVLPEHFGNKQTNNNVAQSAGTAYMPLKAPLQSVTPAASANSSPFRGGVNSSSPMTALPAASNSPSLTPIFQMSPDSSGSTSTVDANSQQSKQVRRATRIAPAPTVHPTTVSNQPNGSFPAPITFQGCPPALNTWNVKSGTTTHKKRGRKRKHPQLSEAERAFARKEQNRESARMSRVRRKVIAAEYEGKLSELINENSLLRKQVEGLNNRLAYLQSILTITVRPEPTHQ